MYGRDGLLSRYCGVFFSLHNGMGEPTSLCLWYECWYNNTTVLLGTELGGVIVRTRVELGSASGADG